MIQASRHPGVTTDDIFGAESSAEPATPGSYGLQPEGFRLPAATRLGPVRLQISDLERSLAFYGRVIGLRLLGREDAKARLGTPDGEVLVELIERQGVRPAPRRGRTGLFHFAILLPDRQSLGRFTRHLGKLGFAAGSADHLVSEAFYLHDPDHLGIEVYADRPRGDWRRIGRELMMSTDPLDLEGVVRAGADEPWDGVPEGTVMGHVHLHVGDLGMAAEFYSEALGFDRTVWQYPGALFLAAGGYHHHLGTNVWSGRDATPPGDDEAQLLEWTIELPDEASRTDAVESARRAGFHAVEDGADGAAVLRDPWGTTVRIRLRATQA